jgi:hypothetical protein
MKKRPRHAWQLLAAVCLLLLAACGDKHEPVKPTVIILAAPAH